MTMFENIEKCFFSSEIFFAFKNSCALMAIIVVNFENMNFVPNVTKKKRRILKDSIDGSFSFWCKWENAELIKQWMK